MKLVHRMIFFIVSVCFLFGCGQQESRREYVEVVIKPKQKQVLPSQQMNSPQMQALVQDSLTESQFVWQLPQGWGQTIGSGMRVATFFPNADQAVQTTLTSFGGSMGGVEANVVRWLRQLNLNLSSEELKGFLEQSSLAGEIDHTSGLIFDFSSLVSDAQSSSMIVALYPLAQETVFLKLMAPREKVEMYKQDFLKIAESLKRK